MKTSSHKGSEALLRNAIASIQVGVEDYESPDERRVLSAFRNIFAGVILVCKDVLRRLSPPDSNDLLIQKQWRAERANDRSVHLKGSGTQTIGHVEIVERFSDLGLRVDLSGLRTLARIRNDIEHRYSNQEPKVIREALAAAMPIIRSVIVNELEMEPVDALGNDTWNVLLKVNEVHEEEAAHCRATFENMDWKSDALSEASNRFLCAECGSSLVKQVDAENNIDYRMELVCSACGASLDTEKMIEAALRDHFEWDSYVAMTDGGELPLVDCPECSCPTFIVEEDQCISCGFSVGDRKCAICSGPLGVDDFISGDGMLCSYHAWVADKERDR